MSENIINQITLDCLINREIYEKQKYGEKNIKINRKDKKFYRKRILNLTRELLLSKKENNEVTDNLATVVTPDLLNAFNNFVKVCIHNFKIVDKNDIIQEEYKDINIEVLNENINQENYEEKPIEDNRLFMRSTKAKPSLDNFVKCISKKEEELIILPKIREINLKEPKLRNKGIKKKENINIVYDENTEK
jgi:hypothetical protein